MEKSYVIEVSEKQLDLLICGLASLESEAGREVPGLDDLLVALSEARDGDE